MTADGLRDFTSDYLYKKRIEWAPVTISTGKQESFCASKKSHRIYQKDTALMPSYSGHIPGAKYK